MPVSPGDPLDIPASDWNDVQSLLNRFRRGLLSFDAIGLIFNSPASWVWVKNISASNVTAGDILGLGDPVITPTQNAEEFKTRISFQGSIPSTSTPHYDRYGVCQEPADKTDGYCRCVVAGATLVKLTITHAEDLYCEIANGVSTSLTTGALGSSRILWKESGTGGSKWGIIRVGEPSGEILVKNDSGGNYAANGGPHDYAVLTGTPNSETPTGQTVSAYNIAAFNDTKKGTAAIIQKGYAYVSPQQN